jgi:predicted glycosyltransferase
VTGPNTAEADVARLRAHAGSGDGGDNGVVVTRFLPDLQAAIARAKVSVSRAGYNTVADVYRAGCRAVIVPLGDGEETEQITRAALLAEAGLAETVDARGQTAEAVAAAIDRALARPVPDRSRIDLEGAPKTAAIVAAILSGADLAAYR